MTRKLPVMASLSIWDPIHLGIDETGDPMRVTLIERNILIGGEPGGGKSNALNLVAAHAVLSTDCRRVLLDGKQVELGMWRDCADVFVGPSMSEAVEALKGLQTEMNERYQWLLDNKLRKIDRNGEHDVIVVVIDELAYFSATIGKKAEREEFCDLTRDLVQRGRAAGVIMVVATQRPSAKIVPTELRDLFGYRWAFRCTTDTSSDVILGEGWSRRGFSATDVDPAARGVGYLLAEGGSPRRMKAAYLSDDDIGFIADYASTMHGPGEAA